MNVFTYGSLMFEPVWRSVVTDGPYASVPAVLAGYRRHGVSGHSYPGVVAHAGAQVRGRLYLGVSEADVARLDAFEGGDYDRVSVVVHTGEGATAPAQPGDPRPADPRPVDPHPVDPQQGGQQPAELYLYRLADRLVDADWDPQWFAREGIHLFMRDYCPSARDGSG